MTNSKLLKSNEILSDCQRVWEFLYGQCDLALIKIVDLTERVLSMGWQDPKEVIARFGDCHLYALFNTLADPRKLNQKGLAIDASEKNFGSAKFLYLDFDHGLPESLPLEPSLIIQSSAQGFHAYFKVDGLESESLKTVKELQKSFTSIFPSADLAFDPLRMLRLPGSINVKPSKQFQTRIHSFSGKTYSLAEIRDFVNTHAQPTEISTQTSSLEGLSHCESTWLRYLAFQFLPNQFGKEPAEGGRNNYLNKISFLIFKNWSALIPPELIAESLLQWHSTWVNPMPENEAETVIKKFLTHDSAKPTYLSDSNPDDIQRWNIAYRVLLSRFAVRVDEQSGKTTNDLTAQRQIQNFFLCRLNSNLAYSPRKNIFINTQIPGYPQIDLTAILSRGSSELFSIKQTEQLASLLKNTVFEPVQNYFASLPKISKQAAEEILNNLFDVMELDTVDRIQVKKWLCLTAKRAYKGLETEILNPYILIFHGAQGIGKSAFSEILGGEFYSSYHKDNDKDLRKLSSLIVEFAELDRFSFSDQAMIKNEITALHDSIRHKYERFTVNLNRLYSFTGSTNTKEILRDQTGARRFLVVHLRQKENQPYDISFLKNNRNKIWASALALSEDEPLQFTDAELELINKRRESFQAISHIEELLREWMQGRLQGVLPYRPNTGYSYSQIHQIISPGKNLTAFEKTQLLEILAKLGFVKKRGRDLEGKPCNFVVSPLEVKQEILAEEIEEISESESEPQPAKTDNADQSDKTCPDQNSKVCVDQKPPAPDPIISTVQDVLQDCDSVDEFTPLEEINQILDRAEVLVRNKTIPAGFLRQLQSEIDRLRKLKSVISQIALDNNLDGG